MRNPLAFRTKCSFPVLLWPGGSSYLLAVPWPGEKRRFLFVRPPVAVDKADIYGIAHPPQAARMMFLMYRAIDWCKQNRPGLEAWMTPDCCHKQIGRKGDETG